jgi:hypothetical protein
MPLRDPPAGAASLADLPSEPLRGRHLYRVWRAVGPEGDDRSGPWWFGSRPAGRAATTAGGRYDLAEPMGTCYTATSPIAAVVEALQAHLSLLPRAELAARRLTTIVAPDDAPPAAELTARRTAAVGVTAALWAGGDRLRTQRWAAALRRDGWWAIHGGVQHDPSGQLRAVALFDHAGSHPPSYGTPWTASTSTLHDDEQVADGLAESGIAVHEPGDLPFVDPPA